MLSVAACRGGQSVASASSSGTVCVWQVEYTTRAGGQPDRYTGIHSRLLSLHVMPGLHRCEVQVPCLRYCTSYAEHCYCAHCPCPPCTTHFGKGQMHALAVL